MAITVVLIDRHALLREGLALGLEASGISIVGEAGDTEYGVELASTLRPDVVVLGVSPPLVDGIDATRRLTSEAPPQKVVVLADGLDRHHIDRTLGAGAIGYLTKDCSIADVAAAVRAAHSGDTVLDPALAALMLDEAPRVIDEASVLSPREREVLQLVVDGMPTAAIGEALFISNKTVKNHLSSIYAKLGANDRTQAVLNALRMGIIDLD